MDGGAGAALVLLPCVVYCRPSCGSCRDGWRVHLAWPSVLTPLPTTRRLDALESDMAEVRAASILHGLGFNKEMQVRLWMVWH